VEGRLSRAEGDNGLNRNRRAISPVASHLRVRHIDRIPRSSTRDALQAKTSLGADADAARARGLAAYREFLTLWKGADPDIPVLTHAKAEYAKLQ